MVRIYRPKKHQHSKEYGFCKCMRTASGREVLVRRRAEGCTRPTH